jgi:hypothetical protein
MELKAYQQRVIDELTAFLGYLERHDEIRAAFRAYWDDRGATGMESYNLMRWGLWANSLI